MRLAVAACLAAGIHAALFWMELPQSRPAMTIPLSRAVSIDLVTFEQPIEKPPPPKPRVVKPKPKPPPKPRPKPEPVAKPVKRPPPEPPPALPDPEPEDFAAPETVDPDDDLFEETPAPEPEAVEAPADDDDDRAAVQASVPLYDLNPPPLYPRTARRRNYQGTVILDVFVTAHGKVAQVRIAESSGYEILDRSAVKSVQGWRFAPARRAGHPIQMWVQVPVRFELH
jgi:protein TonB